MSNRTVVSALLLAALLPAGCGSASDGGTSVASTSSPRSSEPPRPGRCRAGGSALAPIPGAPAWWREGKRDPVALACLPSGSSGGAALVGFAMGGSSCVVSYGFQTQEALDERCTEPGTSWTVQCEGQLGCTSAFAHEPGRTQLDGPVDAKVKRVQVSVAGRPLKEGVMFAAVKGRLLRAIGAREPFGFFFVSIPRCVAPGAVGIELFGADGSRLGKAQGWDVVVAPCPKLSREGAPSP